MMPHRASLALALLAAAACADPGVGTAPEPTGAPPGLVVIAPAGPTVVVDATTPGYYNQAIGNTLNGTSAAFPATGDPTLTFPDPPDLSPAAAILGNWLGAPPPANGNWTGPMLIPAGWAVNTETAAVYPFLVEASNCVNLIGHFGVDNGIFVWLDGVYRLGRMQPGGVGAFEYPNVGLGTVAPGTHYLQVLREDHGGLTGMVLRVDAFLANLNPTAHAGGPYTVAQGQPVTLDGRGSSDTCGDRVVDWRWDLDAGDFPPFDFETPGATVTTSYSTPGTYRPWLQVADAEGRADTARATVTVTNVSPTITRLKLDPFVLNRPKTNQPFRLSWVFTDPGATDGPWPWRMDWGDGTSTTGSAAARGQIDLTHVYTSPGPRMARFTIGDAHGGSVSRTIPVDVQ